jgi:GPH family glycoside/pentoside/hexuronide:cation symporter
MRLTLREKAGYGMGDSASNFVWALMMNFILYFYTDIFGITAAAAGTMLLFARASDGIADFVIGVMADRTRSRWGRFRPYLVWMAMPLAIVFVLTFSTPDFSLRGKVVYAWITYNALMLCYSLINIPYGALSGVMTDDPLERTSLNSWRMACAQGGGILANTSFLWLVKSFGQGDDAAGARWTVTLYSAIAVSLFFIAFATTTERIQPPVTRRRLRDELRTLLANRHWRIVVIGGLAQIAFAVVRGSGSIYYLKVYQRWDEGRIGAFFLASGVAMMCGAALSRRLVVVMGKKQAFIVSSGIMAFSALPFYWLVPGQTGMVFGFQALGMLAAGVNATLFWAIVADTADFAEWKFNVCSTGVVFSSITCAQKLGMGLGAMIAGRLLTGVGYTANGVPSSSASHGILLLMSVVPAVGFLMVSLLFCRYGLTEAICKTIREDLAARRSVHDS